MYQIVLVLYAYVLLLVMLASFEGKYPKDLFNKPVCTGDNQAPKGYVARDTDDLIVVFSESNNNSGLTYRNPRLP
jgi:hypothetical protein